MTEQNNVQNGTSNGTSNGITQSVVVVEAANSEINITSFATERERYLSEYTAFAVKTAKSTVEMCRIVYEAKTKLAKYEYLRFLRDIHHSSEDSTIRKYLAIGERYDKLIQYTNLLPSSWTSIYAITQIPSEVLDALVSTGSSMANLKGAQIKLLKDTNKKSDADDSKTDADTTDATVADSVNADAAATTADTAAVATPTTASTAATSTTDTTAADLAHAQQATASLLERVAQTAAANAEANVASDDDLADEPYDVVIHFRSRPSEAATFAMLDAITSVISKHRLDAEITSSRTCEAD